MSEEIEYQIGNCQDRNFYRHRRGEEKGVYIGVCFDPQDTQLVVGVLNDRVQGRVVPRVLYDDLKQLRDEARDEAATLRDLLRAALPILAYVSTGRSYVDVEPYPDASARRVAALIDDAIGPVNP